MNDFLFKKKFNYLTHPRPSCCTKQQSLALASVLSLGILSMPYNVFAADLSSQLGTNIQLNDGDSIVADLRNESFYLYGVANSMGTSANFDLANNVSITTNGPDSSVGVFIWGNNGLVKANQLQVKVEGTSTAYGIYGEGSENNLNLGTNTKIITSGGTVYGIILGANTILEANALTVEAQGENNAVGLNITSGGNNKINLGENSVIRATGKTASGIGLSGEFTANALTVDVKGTQGSNFGIGTSLSYGTVTKIGDNSHISVENGTGINAASLQNVKIDFFGTETQRNTISVSGDKSFMAVATMLTATVNLDNTDITVDYSGSNPYESIGLAAMSNGAINANNVTLTSTSPLTIGALVVNNGVLSLTGNSAIIQSNVSDTAFMNGEDAASGGTINVSGQLMITGSVIANGGSTNLEMLSGSVWTGSGQNNAGGGVLNVSMTDSQWNMSSDSSLSSLTLNNGHVLFVDHGASNVLTVENLSGNGTFVLNTNIVGESNGVNNSGDKLIITGTSAGNHQLTLLNQGSLATTGNEILTIVETQDGQANFTSTNQVELGGYLYDVRQNGTNWEVYSIGQVIEPPETENPNPSQPGNNNNNNGNNGNTGNNGGGPVITTTADAGANFLNIGYLMNYAETQTLLQRMGDLRQNSQQGNMWLRGFAGKFNSFSGGKLSNFDMSYSGFQLGADKRISVETPLFAGIFVGQTNGSPDYRSGDGSTRSSHMGIYGSYMANNGFYVDTVVKYANIKNNFNVRDSQNQQVSGNGKSQGISASLETGQKFSFGTDNNGFYLEPQLQFSYGHQDASQVKASNGLRVDLGSYESMMGRASTLLGYEINQSDSKVNLYVKTGIVREFDGDVSYRLNGSKEQHSFKGNGWNNGVGVSTHLGNQHTFYLDVDTVNGNKFDQRQVNGGYRFSF